LPETTRIVYAHTRTSVLRDQLNTFGLSPQEALRTKDTPAQSDPIRRQGFDTGREAS
jgi:hypothetical protein